MDKTNTKRGGSMRESVKTAFEWVRLIVMIAFIPMGVWLLVAALTMKGAAVAIEERTKTFMEVKLPEFEERLDRLEEMTKGLKGDIDETKRHVAAVATTMSDAREHVNQYWFFRALFGQEQDKRQEPSTRR